MITRETKAAELVKLQQELGEIEMTVLTQGYTLADAMRDGIRVTDKAIGWGAGNDACALSAAAIAAKAKGLF